MFNYPKKSALGSLKHPFSVSFSVRAVAVGLTFAMFFGLTLPLPFSNNKNEFSLLNTASANSVYRTLTSAESLMNYSASTTNMISSNDDWSNFPSAEGYEGKDLTTTHGVDPRTILTTEFSTGTTNHLLPNSPTNVSANANKPDAVNRGGIAEFENNNYNGGSLYTLAFQGNVHANPYFVFYLDTTGKSNITFSYDLKDIDNATNSSVSQVDVQYRVGDTGQFKRFVNPDNPSDTTYGYVADATVVGIPANPIRVSVKLPTEAENKPKVQVRIITTNAAAPDGSSTPDEWMSVNNVSVTANAPSAGEVSVSGKVLSPFDRGLMNATVSLYLPTGDVRTTRTTAFGRFNFSGLNAGETYVLEVRSKKYTFVEPTQVVTANENVSDITFYAAPLLTPFSEIGIKDFR